jgi:hypothetical protein
MDSGHGNTLICDNLRNLRTKSAVNYDLDASALGSELHILHVCAIIVEKGGRMNITLSADAQVIERTRILAKRKGTSLNQLIRDYMEQMAGARQCDSAAEEFRQLALEKGGRSSLGFQFDREEANARR